MSSAKPNPAQVIGYSERGLVNATVNFIRSDGERIRKLLLTIEWPSVKTPDAIEKTIKALTDFELFVEPSFGQFGDPDLIIVGRLPDDPSPWVFFLEAKIVSWAHSAKPNDEGMSKPGFNSAINGQLSLRYRLARALAAWDDVKGIVVESKDVLNAARDSAHGVREPRKTPRYLRKESVRMHVASKLRDTNDDEATRMARSFFVAWTLDAKSPLPGNHEARTFPHESAFGSQAQEHTGWLGWEPLEEALRELLEFPEYKQTRELSIAPVLEIEGHRAKSPSRQGSTVRTQALTTFGKEHQAAAESVALTVTDAASRADLLATAETRTGSWSVVVEQRVVGKVMLSLDEDAALIHVGLAADVSFPVPAFFDGKEETINGRRFQFVTLRDGNKGGGDAAFVGAVDEYMEDLASGSK